MSINKPMTMNEVAEAETYHPYSPSAKVSEDRCLQCGQSAKASCHSETCKVAKADVQQLKSIRDGLCNSFRDADKMAAAAPNRAQKSASDRKVKKLTPQISAINRIIKYLEAELK